MRHYFACLSFLLLLVSSCTVNAPSPVQTAGENVAGEEFYDTAQNGIEQDAAVLNSNDHDAVCVDEIQTTGAHEDISVDRLDPIDAFDDASNGKACFSTANAPNNSTNVVACFSAIDSVNVESCFSTVIAEYASSFVASSLLTAKKSNGEWVIALNSPEDDVIFVQFDDSNVVVKTVAQLAQVSCLEPLKDGLRLGLIGRDAVKGFFYHEAQVFDDNLNVNPKNTWRVSARGFQSDAGTLCGFLGETEILVTGIRPRGNKTPHHGLFNVQKRKLHFFENTQAHTPVLLSLHKNEDATEVLLKEVVRDENDKAVHAYSVYQLNNDNTSMALVMTADFIVHNESGWLPISQNGCCSYADKQLCLNSTDVLSDVVYLGEADGPWMLWNAPGKSWIVHLTNDGVLKSVPIAENRRAVYIDDQHWAIYEHDSLTPDIGTNLKMIRVNHDCLNRSAN